LQLRPTLLQTLVQKQNAAGLSDREFSAELGLSRSFWTQVRTGRRRITVAVLRAVLRRFPEMEGAVLEFLKGRNGAGK